MKIAIAQINTIIGDFDHNVKRIKDVTAQAIQRSCDLIVFPELVIPGYPPRDLLERDDFVNANLSCFNGLVESVWGIGVVGGFVDHNPAASGKSLLNSAALFEDGKIVHKAIKCLLPTYDVFDERRYFEAGTACKPFNYKGNRVGLTVCEDVWNDKDIFRRRIYPVDPVDQLMQGNVDLLINISASPFSTGKPAFRRKMLGSIAAKHKVPLIFSNQVGGNDSVLFDGASAAFGPDGEITASAFDFKEDLIVCDPVQSVGDLHPVSASETEAVLKALIMGTRDYVRKCGFSKTLIGLSGGIDSALTTYIAVSALGRKNVSTVFMPSPYTSRDNYEDTRHLAENLGIDYDVIPIKDIFNEFLQLLSPLIKGNKTGITAQNLQARIRGTILMAYSNERGCLLLSTGNKSEMAIGYCTLYGDMSGGLSVISDVPKTMVYDLARWINRDRETIPTRITTKAPSAELRPDQTDQDDLPPYDILDRILKGYVEEVQGVDQIVKSGIDRGLVEGVVGRITHSEYKRQQAPPGLKVTTKAFGYGRRYPIAQKYF